MVVGVRALSGGWFSTVLLVGFQPTCRLLSSHLKVMAFHSVAILAVSCALLTIAGAFLVGGPIEILNVYERKL